MKQSPVDKAMWRAIQICTRLFNCSSYIDLAYYSTNLILDGVTCLERHVGRCTFEVTCPLLLLAFPLVLNLHKPYKGGDESNLNINCSTLHNSLLGAATDK